MKDFKFFQKGTVDMPEISETFLTASFNDDTPEGVMRRRILYHTDITQYERLRHPNDPERFRQPNHQLEQFRLYSQIRERTLEEISSISQRVEDTETLRPMIPYQSNDIGMSNYTPPENESYYQRFFPRVTVTQVKTKWWMKVKSFFQGCWDRDPTSTIVLITNITGLLFYLIILLFKQ